MKKETLKVTDNYLYEDMSLYAISSSESDILICQTFNNIFGINLALAENLEITKKKEIISFRRYIFIDDEEIEKYALYSNRSGGQFLFPELKKIDYIFIVITEAPRQPIEDKIQQMKNLPEITALYQIDNKKLKSLTKIHF